MEGTREEERQFNEMFYMYMNENDSVKEKIHQAVKKKRERSFNISFKCIMDAYTAVLCKIK